MFFFFLPILVFLSISLLFTFAKSRGAYFLILNEFRHINCFCCLTDSNYFISECVCCLEKEWKRGGGFKKPESCSEKSGGFLNNYDVGKGHVIYKGGGIH